MASGLAARLVTRSTAQRTFVPATYAKTTVPTDRERHLLNRLGYGFTPAALKELRALGGEQAWLDQQLDPDSIAEHPKAVECRSWFPDLDKSAAQIWADDRAGRKMRWHYAKDLVNWTLLRRIYSRRTVHEQMTEFWSHHFHVNSKAHPAFVHRIGYDAVIREKALGTFEDLLIATSLHPAMLLYLDNWKSVRNAPNENQGRELLELHTVGIPSGYTEAMVKDSAKILSGYTVVEDTWEPIYDSGMHTTGSVTVLGFTRANTSSDGRQLTLDYLSYLAHHPATAQRIARKLCVRFVSDTPSQDIVDHVANAFLESGTDIKATLRALVAHPDFWASAGGKIRTASDDVVATCRVLGVRALSPEGPNSFANRIISGLKVIPPFQWVTPDGPPDEAWAWVSPSRMLNSWRMHHGLAGGWWPRGRVAYRKPAAYLPQAQLRLDEYVDHLSRRVLGRPSTATLLQAVCEGIDVAPGDVIHRKHAVCRYKFPKLLSILLDSPAHMTR